MRFLPRLVAATLWILFSTDALAQSRKIILVEPGIFNFEVLKAPLRDATEGAVIVDLRVNDARKLDEANFDFLESLASRPGSQRLFQNPTTTDELRGAAFAAIRELKRSEEGRSSDVPLDITVMISELTHKGEDVEGVRPDGCFLGDFYSKIANSADGLAKNRDLFQVSPKLRIIKPDGVDVWEGELRAVAIAVGMMNLEGEVSLDVSRAGCPWDPVTRDLSPFKFNEDCAGPPRQSKRIELVCRESSRVVRNQSQQPTRQPQQPAQQQQPTPQPQQPAQQQQPTPQPQQPAQQQQPTPQPQQPAQQQQPTPQPQQPAQQQQPTPQPQQPVQQQQPTPQPQQPVQQQQPTPIPGRASSAADAELPATSMVPRVELGLPKPDSHRLRFLIRFQAEDLLDVKVYMAPESDPDPIHPSYQLSQLIETEKDGLQHYALLIRRNQLALKTKGKQKFIITALPRKGCTEGQRIGAKIEASGQFLMQEGVARQIRTTVRDCSTPVIMETFIEYLRRP